MAMCEFDAATLRCTRCGWQAKRLPTFRKCQTVLEAARSHAEAHATRRIRLPRLRPGTALEGVLTRVGITKERIAAATGKPCNCAARAKALDRAAASAITAAENALNWVANAVAPHPVSDEEVAAIANMMVHGKNANQGLIDAAAKAQADGQ